MNNFYEAKVIAGQPYVAPYSGQFFAISDTGAARSVSLRFVVNGSEQNLIKNMTSGFETQMAFDRVIFQSDVDTVISFFASSVPVRLGNRDGMQVKVQADNPLPVNFAGTVNPVLGSVGVTNDENTPIPAKHYQAKTVSDLPAVAVTSARVAIVAAASTRRGIRIKNAGLSPVAIGGDTVDYAAACVQIMPGETWNESEAAPAAWYAICDAGQTSTLNIQVIV